MRKIAVTPPEWLMTSSIYQINPRTFSAEGTIKAVTKELPFLAELGFGAMYLCPIFEADDSEDRAYWSVRQKASETGNAKNPYRMNDYFKIDSEYGTMEDLYEFVQEAHRLGMRVLLDLVYMHIGPNAPIIKTHPEFAQQDAEGNIIYSKYFFPYLDFNCQGLREYLWSNMTYYIGALDVDGFRCDVADAVPIDFWVEGRRRIHEIKPDAVLISEGYDWSYLERGFDVSYCFDWHKDVYGMFSGKYNAADVRRRSEERSKEIPKGGMLLRDIDTHDTVTDWPVRTEILAGHDGMELIEVLNYFIDGIPMVYCGNELGDTAKLSMFANRFHMGKFEVTDRSIATEEYSIRRQQIIKRLNQLKKEYSILRYGTTEWLDNSNAENVVSFRRVHGDKQVIVIANVADAECKVTVEKIPGDCSVLLENKGMLIDKGVLKLEARGYIVLENNE